MGVLIKGENRFTNCHVPESCQISPATPYATVDTPKTIRP